VPIGSPAGAFVEQYRERLFPHTPILYTGMDRRRLGADALENNAAFVGESFDVPGFIQDILQLAPETTNIVCIIGASRVEQYWTMALQSEFARFTNRVSFTWLNELSFEQMLEQSPPAMQAALAAAPLVTLYKQYVVRFGLGYSEQVGDDVQVAGYTEPVV